WRVLPFLSEGSTRWVVSCWLMAPVSGSGSVSLVVAHQLHAQLPELRVQLADGLRVEPGEELEDPAFVLLRHGLELAPALGGEAHDPCPAVGRAALARDEPFLLEVVGESRHVAARHHEAARQLAHLHAVLVAEELREVVEAGERDAEALAQARAD